MNLNQERLDKINNIILCKGIGKDLDRELCIMQAVDYVTGGSGESDHPSCVCPTLTSYAIRLNDRLGDEDRQKLKALIPLLVGTVNSKLRLKRAKLLLYRNVTVVFPILLDLLDLPELAASLRAAEDANDAMLAASALINVNKPNIREAALKRHADAAYAAAYADAAADAADAAYAYAAAYAADADAAADAAYAAYAADADAVKRINQERIESLRLACLVAAPAKEKE